MTALPSVAIRPDPLARCWFEPTGDVSRPGVSHVFHTGGAPHQDTIVTHLDHSGSSNAAACGHVRACAAGGWLWVEIKETGTDMAYARYAPPVCNEQCTVQYDHLSAQLLKSDFIA